ncbi:MAG: cytochrome c, partial [Balneolaceae bacterium]|nr:cytochrome c [Balneolaceae bacterium]
YQVKRWSYKRTENYGSGHYKLNDTPGEELLPVFSAHVSEDGKGLFLAVPDMKPSMQIEISYKINAADGYVMNNRFWATAHDLPPANLNGNGFPNLNIEELLLSASRTLEANRDEEEQEISLERGRQLFRRTGCIGCHSIDGTEKGYYGPSMQDLFGSARSLDNGTKATADSAYIRESILYPERKIVEGYGQEMPSFVGILTDDEIASITQYIRSLNSGKSSSP